MAKKKNKVISVKKPVENTTEEVVDDWSEDDEEPSETESKPKGKKDKDSLNKVPGKERKFLTKGNK